jgi:hypothetical protein
MCTRLKKDINGAVYENIKFMCTRLKKDINSAVYENIKFMCTRLKNWDKGEVHRALPQFSAEYT